MPQDASSSSETPRRRAKKNREVVPRSELNRDPEPLLGRLPVEKKDEREARLKILQDDAVHRRWKEKGIFWVVSVSLAFVGLTCAALAGLGSSEDVRKSATTGLVALGTGAITGGFGFLAGRSTGKMD